MFDFYEPPKPHKLELEKTLSTIISNVVQNIEGNRPRVNIVSFGENQIYFNVNEEKIRFNFQTRLFSLNSKQSTSLLLLRALNHSITRMDEKISTIIWRFKESQEVVKDLYFRDILSPQFGLLRINFLCNQNCSICWQDRKWKTYSSETFKQWIGDMASQGIKHLFISGGEPTIDKNLFDYIEHAKVLGINEFSIETNAMLFSRDIFLDKFKGLSGVTYFVSLHSSEPKISDQITGVSGAFEKTVLGIDKLLNAEKKVNLNFVITPLNIDTLIEFPEFLSLRWNKYLPQIKWMISNPTKPFGQGFSERIHPHKVKTILQIVIGRAKALNISLLELDGTCGFPICYLNGYKLAADFSLKSQIIADRVFGYSCQTCKSRNQCYGVRREDFDLYKEDVFFPNS